MIWIKNSQNISKKLKAMSAFFLAVVLIVLTTSYSQLISDGVKKGMNMCMQTLIPSLFIFMVLSAYLSGSKIFDTISNATDRLCHKFFKLSGVYICVLLVSIIGGYPIGATCIKSLINSKAIDVSQGRKLSLVSVCSGSGFVFNFLGAQLFHNKAVATILFSSQLVGFFVTCLVWFFVTKPSCEQVIFVPKKNYSTIVDAVHIACKSTVTMCGMVVLFCAILNICENTLAVNDVLCDALYLIFEVSTACDRLCTKYPLYIISFSLGFGGLCVHFQIFSILRDLRINKVLFFLFRIIQGISSAVCTYILLIFTDPIVDVFCSNHSGVAYSRSTVTGSIALILTAVCFLNSLKFSQQKRR